MITNFKKWFNRTKEPKEGDYVVCEYDFKIFGKNEDFEMKNFIENNIGQIYIIESHKIYIKNCVYDSNYAVLYENIPEELKIKFFTLDSKYVFYFSREQIKEFSKNKEDLEHFISANKYNI